MAQFPDAKPECDALRDFIADPRYGQTFAAVDLADLRSKASRLAARLSVPVRVAIAGLPGAGKTSLANFLAGSEVIPPTPQSGPRPPVVLAHGPGLQTVAGWWSGAQIVLEGKDFEAALRDSPDYVELKLPNTVLQNVSFLDMPGEADAERQTEQITWMVGRADIVLWCSHGAEAWNEVEKALWSTMPKRLRDRSLLVLTHGDIGGTDAKAVLDAALPKFGGVVTIASPLALAAAPEGVVGDFKAWSRSGAKAMLRNLLTLIQTVRNADIELARQLIETGIAPLRTKLPKDAKTDEPSSTPLENAAPAQSTKPEQERPPSTAKEADPQSPAEADEGGALAEARELVLELAGQVPAAGETDNQEFLWQAAELADKLKLMLGKPGVLRDEAKWLEAELNEAVDRLRLLQMESGEQPFLDAAAVVLQLSRDLGWAVAPADHSAA